MGYEITFTGIPEDVLDKYKTGKNESRDNLIESLKYVILENCIKYDSKFENNISGFISRTKQDLNFIGNIQADAARQDFYQEYMNDDKYSPSGSFTLCGTEYRDFTCNGCEDKNNDITSYCLEQLLILGVFNRMPDYDDDSGKWCDRYNDMVEVINYCISATYINAMKMIRNELYEYSDEFKCDEDLSDIKNN